MRRVVPLLLLVLLALLAGCGEKQDVLEPSGSKQVTLMLDYFPNADHAGIYAAQAAGDFKQAGLDVEIRQPADPSAPIKQVAAGRVDVAISYEPEVFRARDKGLNVVERRRAGQQAAHLDHLAAGGEDPQARRPQGQDGRHGRHRLPDGLPRHDPRRGRACSATRSRSATSASASPPPC